MPVVRKEDEIKIKNDEKFRKEFLKKFEESERRLKELGGDKGILQQERDEQETRKQKALKEFGKCFGKAFLGLFDERW